MPIHIFRDNIMATVFELRLVHDDVEFAGQAAQAAFATAHQIEALLSRFMETSEIARIRTLQPGQSLRLHAHTAACLKTAQEMMQFTGGAFDPSVTPDPLADDFVVAGDVHDHDMAQSSQSSSALQRATLSLDAETMTLFCDGPSGARPVHLDLGAIGKGYALDMMALDLQDWDITSALLLAGGSSSILALNGPGSSDTSSGWCISLSSKQLLFLENAAVSASGTAVKGAHILDPRTGRPPVDAPARTWAIAPTAAVSDALSTAWMLLSQCEMQSLCDAGQGIAAILEISDRPDAVEPLLFISKTPDTSELENGYQDEDSGSLTRHHFDNFYAINSLS